MTQIAADVPRARSALQRSRRLADFTADHRTLILAALAVCVGALGTVTAWLLMKMITLVTSIVWFGCDVIGDLINNRMAFGAVLLIILVKSTIWLVSLSSGTSGGILAPLLIIGGALGWLVGTVLPGNPGFWALVGMSSMLAYSMRAPLTGAMFAVEVTGILQGVRGSALRHGVGLCGDGPAAQALDPDGENREARPAYHLRICDRPVRGHACPRDHDEGSRNASRVDADRRRDRFFQSDASIHLGYPIVDAENRFVGYVTRREALAWQVEDAVIATETLGDRLSDAIAADAHPDDPVGYIVDLMIAEGKGMIAVVEPETRKLHGIITRKDILDVRRVTRVEEQERARFYARRWTETAQRFLKR